MGDGDSAEGEQLTTLLVDKHVDFIKQQNDMKDTFEYFVTEHLRVSGAYWGLTSLHLMGRGEEVDGGEVIEWLLKCQHSNGGFGGNIDHDPHLLYTTSAVQLFLLYGKMELLDVPKVVDYIAALQQDDGSFVGDEWGEVDTRFVYCAVLALRLLGRLDAIDVDKAVAFIGTCKNFDGGYGCVPGAETHAAQVFCCVQALAVMDRLDGEVDRDLLGWWLAERQVSVGGLNGRPEKKPDVCYSWWVLSSLHTMRRVHWIDGDALARFILRAQDPVGGGIADRPEDMPDIFHTFFGIAGLALLGKCGLGAVSSVYALPRALVAHLPNGDL